MYIHLPWLLLTGEPNITDITHVHQIVQNGLAGFVREVQDTPFNPVPLVAILKGIPDEDEPWIKGKKIYQAWLIIKKYIYWLECLYIGSIIFSQQTQ